METSLEPRRNPARRISAVTGSMRGRITVPNLYLALPASYQSKLASYIALGGEAPLNDAYDLGRRAIDLGMGLLEFLSMHQKALSTLIRSNSSDIRALWRAADCFLLEGLAPYEFLALKNSDSNVALQRTNEILEAEAKRIAENLHDQAGQVLASAYLELAEIKHENLPPQLMLHAERLTHCLDLAREQLRRLSHELHPLTLDQLGLIPALHFLAEGFRKRDKLNVEIENLLQIDGRLPRLVESTLYRAVQEALNNAALHARASKVAIRLWIENQRILCSIADNGIGFSRPTGTNMCRTTDQGLGLLGIRERAGSLHGALTIETAPGAGTKLTLKIPLVAAP